MKTIIRAKTQIDAAGKSVGRIASDVARLLQGKHLASYTPNIDQGDMVEVVNAAQVKLTGNKIEDKTYYHYSGYPGGMRHLPMKTVMAKNPGEVIARAVKNMLPKNRLQKGRLKRLTVKN